MPCITALPIDSPYIEAFFNKFINTTNNVDKNQPDSESKNAVLPIPVLNNATNKTLKNPIKMYSFGP